MKVVSVFVGDKYNSLYVKLLESMIPGIEFLTDRPWGMQVTGNFPGWWAKMELFAPWWYDQRPFLFFDLDTYVLGDISDLLSNDGKMLWMLKDVYTKKHSGSGIMVIPKDTEKIWTDWEKNSAEIMKRCGRLGDQSYISTFQHRELQPSYPGIYSYKVHCRNVCPPDARIVYFHGQPKPHNVKGWAGKVWEKYTQQ